MQTIYVETSIISYLAGRRSRNHLVAAVHNIDLLLTWNCRHIDNPSTKPMVRSVCAAHDYRCPEICTPIELLEAMTDEK